MNMPEEQKLEWKEENLKYIGRELKNESKEGSNKKWKIFKLKFDIERDFPFTIDCFNTLGNKKVMKD